MARVQATISASAVPAANTTNNLGSSGSGDMVIEIDATKFKTFAQLKTAVVAALKTFEGLLPP